jgi:hypothetical protein
MSSLQKPFTAESAECAKRKSKKSVEIWLFLSISRKEFQRVLPKGIWTMCGGIAFCSRVTNKNEKFEEIRVIRGWS